MTKSKPTIVVFAALIVLGAALDAQACVQGGGLSATKLEGDHEYGRYEQL